MISSPFVSVNGGMTMPLAHHIWHVIKLPKNTAVGIVNLSSWFPFLCFGDLFSNISSWFGCKCDQLRHRGTADDNSRALPEVRQQTAPLTQLSDERISRFDSLSGLLGLLVGARPESRRSAVDLVVILPPLTPALPRKAAIVITDPPASLAATLHETCPPQRFRAFSMFPKIIA